MFAKTSIRLRLIGTMALLGLLIVITGASGLYGMARMNDGMREVSTNTMPSAIAIAKSQQGLSRARLVADRVLLHPEAKGALKALQRAENFLNESGKAWAAYQALPQDDEERRLAAAVDADRTSFIDGAFKPLLKALSDGDIQRADQITMTELQPLFVKFSDSTTALELFQSRTSAKHYEDNQADYRKQQWAAATVIGISVLVIGFACFSLLRSILQPIRSAIGHFNKIAEGDLSSSIKVDGAEEMAALMTGLAAMQARLAQTVRSVRDGTAAIAVAGSVPAHRATGGQPGGNRVIVGAADRYRQAELG
jgi:methyl-accepting chemotaxis protein-1 (serine sensor receptor)